MQTSVFPEAFKNLFAPIFISFIPIFFFSTLLSHVVRCHLEPRSLGESVFVACLVKNSRPVLCNTNLSIYNGTSPRYGFLSSFGLSGSLLHLLL